MNASPFIWVDVQRWFVLKLLRWASLLFSACLLLNSRKSAGSAEASLSCTCSRICEDLRKNLTGVHSLQLVDKAQSLNTILSSGNTSWPPPQIWTWMLHVNEGKNNPWVGHPWVGGLHGWGQGPSYSHGEESRDGWSGVSERGKSIRHNADSDPSRSVFDCVQEGLTAELVCVSSSALLPFFFPQKQMQKWLLLSPPSDKRNLSVKLIWQYVI